MPIADGQMRNSAGYVLAEIFAIMSITDMRRR